MKLRFFIGSFAGEASIDVSDERDEVRFRFHAAEACAACVEALTAYLGELGLSVDCAEVLAVRVAAARAARAERQGTRAALRAFKDSGTCDAGEFAGFKAFCEATLHIRLRGYQSSAAYQIVLGRGGFNFSVPGSGKTIVTYAAYAYLKARGVVDHVFVIGPGSSYHAWQGEYQTCFAHEPSFEDLSRLAVDEARKYLDASSGYHREIAFVNLEKVRLLTAAIAHCVGASRTLLVIDEAHKIKNPAAAVTQSVLEIARRATVRVILTGTPLPNGYEDLSALFDVYSPAERILPYTYHQLAMLTRRKDASAEAKRIRDSIFPYYSRISKKYLLQTGELPEPVCQTVRCAMQPEQRALYQKLNDFCGKIREVVDQNLLEAFKKAILIRKMQIAANPALLGRSIWESMDELRTWRAESTDGGGADAAALEEADAAVREELGSSAIVQTVQKFQSGEWVPEKNRQAVQLMARLVADGQSVLVWDVFVGNMAAVKALAERALNVPVEVVNGLVAGDDRRAALDRFRRGDSRILLANPATLAESVSLHRVCQNAIYVNRNFNAAQYIQSKDRIHRINMPAGTTAHYWFLNQAETVDEAIHRALLQKERRMLAVLDADDIVIGGAELEDAGILSRADVEASYTK